MDTDTAENSDQTKLKEEPQLSPEKSVQINEDDDEKTNAQNSSTNQQQSNKIEIYLKPVGNAPILKKKKFLLERTKDVKWLNEWLRKYMRLDSKDQLFLYVNQEFAPCLDTQIGTIFDCFGVSNNVIFHYCTTPAWG